MSVTWQYPIRPPKLLPLQKVNPQWSNTVSGYPYVLLVFSHLPGGAGGMPGSGRVIATPALQELAEMWTWRRAMLHSFKPRSGNLPATQSARLSEETIPSTTPIILSVARRIVSIVLPDRQGTTLSRLWTLWLRRPPNRAATPDRCPGVSRLGAAPNASLWKAAAVCRRETGNSRPSAPESPPPAAG